MKPRTSSEIVLNRETGTVLTSRSNRTQSTESNIPHYGPIVKSNSSCACSTLALQGGGPPGETDRKRRTGSGRLPPFDRREVARATWFLFDQEEMGTPTTKNCNSFIVLSDLMFCNKSDHVQIIQNRISSVTAEIIVNISDHR